MDIQRFHYALYSIMQDFEELKIKENFENLVNSLSYVSSSPSQITYVEQYKAQMKSFREILYKSNLNKPSSEIRQFINDLNLEKYIGAGLYENITNEISKHNISPADALEALQGLLIEFNRKFDPLKKIDEGFESLEIKIHQPDTTNFEIEIKIPTNSGAKTLDDLSKETKDWNRIINTISEVFDGNNSQTDLKGIANGSWVLYLGSTALVLFGIAKCLAGLNAILQEIVKGTELIRSLIQAKAPSEVVEGYENHLKNDTATKIENLADTFVEENYKKSDNARKAELKVALHQVLKKLSNKISAGAEVDLKIDPPKLKHDADLEAEDAQASLEEYEKMLVTVQNTLIELDKIQRLKSDPEIVRTLPPPEPD